MQGRSEIFFICNSLEIHFHWREVKHGDRRKEMIERRKEIDHVMNELIAMHELIAFGLIAPRYLL